MATANNRGRESVGILIARESDALDGVMAELSLGVRNQRHYDELEERVDGISRRLRAAFREGRAS